MYFLHQENYSTRTLWFTVQFRDMGGIKNHSIQACTPLDGLPANEILYIIESGKKADELLKLLSKFLAIIIMQYQPGEEGGVL